MNRHSYNAIAREWDVARSGPFSHEPVFLQHFVATMQPPARILDLGGGTGRSISEFLLKKGTLITGVDHAENLLALAQQRFPEGRRLQAKI